MGLSVASPLVQGIACLAGQSGRAGDAAGEVWFAAHTLKLRYGSDLRFCYSVLASGTCGLHDGRREDEIQGMEQWWRMVVKAQA